MWLGLLVLGLHKSAATCEKLQSGFLQNSISSSFSDHKTRVLLYCEIPKIESIALSSLGWPLRQLPLFSKCGCTFAEIWKPSKFCHEMQSRSPLEFRSLLIPPLEASLWMMIFQVSSIHPSTNIKTTCGASPTTASVMQWNFHKVHRGKRIIS